MSTSLPLFIAFLSFQSFSITTQVPAGFLSIYKAADAGGSPGTDTGSGHFSTRDWKQIYWSRRRTCCTSGKISYHNRVPTWKVKFIISSLKTMIFLAMFFFFPFPFPFVFLCYFIDSGPGQKNLFIWLWLILVGKYTNDSQKALNVILKKMKDNWIWKVVWEKTYSSTL